jgi:anti-sigma regulatory factor (Ser/Thr protein kinase)
MPEEMTLEIPADAAFAVTARLFVAAAARGLGVADGTAEDLRLAASELVANAVETRQPGPVHLTIGVDGDEIRLTARGAGRLANDPPISRLALLGALFDARDDASQDIVRLGTRLGHPDDEGQA